MVKKNISVFLLVHGNVYVNIETRSYEETRIIYRIGSEPVPDNVILYAPDILAKHYYENRKNTLTFINEKFRKWNEKGSLSKFSDFMAKRLTNFEINEVKKMYNVIDSYDQKDVIRYEQKQQMPIDIKRSRRSLVKSAILKSDIEWLRHKFYIPEKQYKLDSGDSMILLYIEEIDDGGHRRTRIISVKEDDKKYKPRMNLLDLTVYLRQMCEPTDTITFFDFSCYSIIFPSTGIEQYTPNLLSYQITRGRDQSIRIIYGTILNDIINEMKRDEEMGERGVKFDDSPLSQLTVSSREEGSRSKTPVLSEEAIHPTPEIHVIVPKSVSTYIKFRIHNSSSRSSSRGGRRVGRNNIKKTRRYFIL
jgi:hypothetical protein